MTCGTRAGTTQATATTARLTGGLLLQPFRCRLAGHGARRRNTGSRAGRARSRWGGPVDRRHTCRCLVLYIQLLELRHAFATRSQGASWAMMGVTTLWGARSLPGL